MAKGAKKTVSFVEKQSKIAWTSPLSRFYSFHKIQHQLYYTEETYYMHCRLFLFRTSFLYLKVRLVTGVTVYTSKRLHFGLHVQWVVVLTQWTIPWKQADMSAFYQYNSTIWLEHQWNKLLKQSPDNLASNPNVLSACHAVSPVQKASLDCVTAIKHLHGSFCLSQPCNLALPECSWSERYSICPLWHSSLEYFRSLFICCTINSHKVDTS